MAKNSAREMPIAAKVDVTTDPVVPGIIRVRAVAPSDRKNDARPVAGFYVVRRYDGEVFSISDWKQFSRRWMEFIDEPPKEWLEALEIEEDKRAEVMAKAEAEAKVTPEERLVFAMSQVLGMQTGKSPNAFDASNGKFRE